jgi:hypothetical protein
MGRFLVNCVGNAEKGYSAVWASSCKRVAEEAVANHTHCLAEKLVEKELCDSMYRPSDPSPNCALPRMLASDIEASLDKARSRCLQESKAGL